MDLKKLFFIVGAYGALLQLLLLRECFLLFAGNELSWGVQLGFWLVFTAAGAALGSRLSRRTGARLLALLPLAGVWALAAVRLLPLASPAPVGLETPLPWAAAALAAALLPLNLALGALFPALSGEDAAEAGGCYRLEALGAVIAGAAFTFLLAGKASGVSATFWASAAMAAATSALLRRTAAGESRASLALALALAFASALSPARRLDDLWWSCRQGGSRRLATIETPYQRLDLGLFQGQRTVYSNGAPAFALEDAEEASSGYRLADLYLSLHPGPGRVLVIGEGEPGLPRRIAEYSPRHAVYFLEDEALLGLVARPKPPFEVVAGLDRRRLERSSDSFDLIILDLPPPSSVAGNRFFTEQAFSMARRRLAPGGVFVFRLPSSGEYLAGRAALLLSSVHRALERAFGETAILAGDDMLFIAGAVPKPLSLEALAERFSRRAPGRGRKAAFIALNEPFFDEMRHSEQLAALRASDVPANDDSLPAASYLGVRRWADEMGSGGRTLDCLERLLKRLSGHGLSLAAALCLAAALLSWAGRRLGRPQAARHAALGAAMLVSGFAGMAGELALIYAYQSRSGQLYKAVGALFAAYMLGLAAGAWLGARTGLKERGLLGLRAAMIASCGLSAFVCGADSGMAIGAGIFVCALALGAEFPAALEVYGEGGAGALYAADTMGAALAAFLCGTLLLPLAGARPLLAGVACLHAAAFAALAAALMHRLNSGCD